MLLAVAVIHVDQLVAMHAVDSQNAHDYKVRNQQHQVEGVGFIESPECVVEKMCLEPMAQPALRADHSQKQGTGIDQVQGVHSGKTTE